MKTIILIIIATVSMSAMSQPRANPRNLDFLNSRFIQRVWNAWDFNVWPDDGKDDYTGIQKAIDSSFKLSGITYFVMESGNYCLTDSTGVRRQILFDFTKGRTDHWFEMHVPFLGWCLGCCDTIKVEPIKTGEIKIEAQYFKKGKIVRTELSSKGWWMSNLNMCSVDNADSVTFKLK